MRGNRDFQGSMVRVTIVIVFSGGWLLGLLRISAHGLMPPGWGWLLWASVVIAPLFGFLLAGLYEWALERFLSDPFRGGGGEDIGVQHGPGERLLRAGEYEAAADWFNGQMLAQPDDWRAQARLVEIVAEHLADPERRIEERERLLKMKEAPDGLWMSTALDLGRDWEERGEIERARVLYRSFLWKHPGEPEAEEVRHRLARMESAPPEGAATPPRS